MAHLVVLTCLFQFLLDADVDSYLLTGLSAATEYEVTLTAVYAQQAESDAAVLFEATGEKPAGKAPPTHWRVLRGVRSSDLL